MQIHELNTKALTDPAYVAFDDGDDTYKADFKDIIDDAVAAAFSAADVSDGVVNYTSGDATSPSAWTDVNVLASVSTLAVLLNKISTMIKNVRYLYAKKTLNKLHVSLSSVPVNTSWSGLYYGDVEIPSSIRSKEIVSIMPTRFSSGVPVAWYRTSVSDLTTPALRFLSVSSISGMSVEIDYYYYG